MVGRFRESPMKMEVGDFVSGWLVISLLGIFLLAHVTFEASCFIFMHFPSGGEDMDRFRLGNRGVIVP